MPFKSQAQRRFMFAKHPKLAEEFAEETPKEAKLPEHVKMAEGGEIPLIREPHGELAKYLADPHPSKDVIRSSHSRTLVPRGGEIDKELKPKTEVKDASLGSKDTQMMADGGMVGLTDEAQKRLTDFLTPKDTSTFDIGGNGTTTAKVPDFTPPIVKSPTPPQVSSLPEEDVSTQDNEKIKDSTPGHTAEDLSGVIQGYENQASKYGPEQEQAVLDQILKERGGLGRNIGRGVAAFTDTAGPAFGAGTGESQRLAEDEAAREKMKLESVPTLQGMNEKQLSQKMALEGMNPSSALGKSTAGTLQTIMKQLFPQMSPDQLDKLTQNPTVMQNLFPDLGALLEKQNMSDLKKMEIEQIGQRNKAEAANQGAERKQGALKELAGMGLTGKLIHPDIAKALEQQAGLSTSTASGPYGPTVQRNGSTYIWSPQTGKYHKQ